MQKWALPLVGYLALSGCGGGGGTSSTTTSSSTSLSGTVVDGYVMGATVCIDLNNNGLCDNGEPSAITGNNGGFTLPVNSINETNGKTLLVIGGTDADTGAQLTTPLTSIIDTTLTKQVVTPTTTLVHAYVSLDNMSLAVAKQRVASRLGINSNSIYQDPVANYDNDPETYARTAALYAYATSNGRSFRRVKDDNDDLYPHFDDDNDDNEPRKRYKDAKSNGPVTNTSTSTIVMTQPTDSNGRLLASNCFQCHGTNGTGGFERIAGGEASEVYEYRGKTPSSDIMAPHGQGYTDAQLQSLINYLNQVR